MHDAPSIGFRLCNTPSRYILRLDPS